MAKIMTDIDRMMNRTIPSFEKHHPGMYTDDELKLALSGMAETLAQDRMENAIAYYAPIPKWVSIFRSSARVRGIGGGNGSGKTETGLFEIIMRATGIFPESLRDYPEIRAKFRGPINCRVVCESLTTTLHQVILKKLQWWNWTGVSAPGGEKGHYGWVPKTSLLRESWDKSWSEKLRTLTVLCRDPDNWSKVLGHSTIQFMSHDQDPSDFASGDFHIVMMDEPPRLAIWTENEARTMRVKGEMFLCMTWPDDPAIPVDWIINEVYEKSQGPNKRHDMEWFNLWTTDNPYLDQSAVSLQMDNWSTEMKNVRIYGQPIRFSNRIHPIFTDAEQLWCFSCGKPVFAASLVVEPGTTTHCGQCGSENVVLFCHVNDTEASPYYPTIYALDPHPRKPHMMGWFQVSPYDDVHQVAELLVDGSCEEVAAAAFRLESEMGLEIATRIMDPNMAKQPSVAGINRESSWEEEFADAGLRCDLADSSDVGRQRLNNYLKPDSKTRAPRATWHPRCSTSIMQFKRFVWDDYKKSLEKAQKQTPREINDDFPALWRYVMNLNPTFQMFKVGPQIYRARSGRFESLKGSSHVSNR